MNELVSIIITTYNRKELVRETINCCLNQTYSNIEIILVDDGSTDATGEEINDYIASGSILYHYKKNEERAKARNVGASLARGQFLKFLDSDDLIQDNYIEKCLKYFRQNRECDLIYTDFKILTKNHIKVSEKKKVIKDMYSHLWEENDIAFSSVMMRKESFCKFGGFDETRELSGAEDWEFWVRISKQGCQFGLLPDPVTIIRSHSSNTTMNEINVVIRSALKALELLENKFHDIAPKLKLKFKARLLFLEAIYCYVDYQKIKAVKLLPKAICIDPNLLFKKRLWTLTAKLIMPRRITDLLRNQVTRQYNYSQS